MKIDWQLYESGQMTPEQRREAEAALRSDPQARLELEGLRAFRRELRDTALREPVPTKRLEAALADIAAAAQRRGPVWRPALVAIAACLLLMAAYAVFTQIARDPNQQVARQLDDLDEARSWAEGVADLDLPGMRPAPGATLRGVHASQGFACFDFEVAGKLLHASVSEGLVSKVGCSTMGTDFGHVLAHKATGSARLQIGKFRANVEGSDIETNARLAHALWEGSGKSPVSLGR